MPLDGGAAPLALHRGGVPTATYIPPPPTSEDLPRPSCVPEAPRILPDKPAADPRLPPPYLSVRACLPAWRRLGASRWVLSVLEHGLSLPWRSTPLPYRARPIRQQPAEAAWASREIKRWVTRGFVRRAKASEARKAPWAAATFVADAARKPRLVVDLSVVNDYLEDRPFKYESLASFVAQLQPGDHLVSWDISDAFHHVLLDPADSERLAFVVDGQLYYPLSLPFGLKLAPWALTKVLRPVLAHLRMRGFCLLGYMDDFASCATGTRPGSKAAATSARRRAVACFRRLGIQIHPTKGATVGTTALDLLGFRVDTVRRLLLLPPRRLDSVIGAAHSLLRAASSHRRWIRLRALQRFCGLAVSCSAAVPLARFHLHSLYHCLSGSGPRSQLRLSTAALTELLWWTRLGDSNEVGRALWQQPVVAELTTDACGYGWGALLNRSVPARGFFSLAQQADHINVQELMALDNALDCFPHVTGPGVLRLRLDSTVNVAVLNNMTTRSPALKVVLDRVVSKLSKRCLRAEATWLSSVANVEADKLSRDLDSSDWYLRRDIFLALHHAWGPLTVDRFASSANRQLPRFNSLTAAAGCEAVDGWAQHWGGERNYVNPPISQLSLVLPKLRRDRATAVVIVPEWRAFPWWRELLMAAHASVLLPQTARLFTHGKWASPARRPSWRTAALLIDGNNPAPAASRGGMSPRPPPWPPSAP